MALLASRGNSMTPEVYLASVDKINVKFLKKSMVNIQEYLRTTDPDARRVATTIEDILTTVNTTEQQAKERTDANSKN